MSGWAIRGELILNCNCTVFCPCVVSLGKHPPTEGYCQAWAGVRIDEGHYYSGGAGDEFDDGAFHELGSERVCRVEVRCLSFVNTSQS